MLPKLLSCRCDRGVPGGQEMNGDYLVRYADLPRNSHESSDEEPRFSRAPGLKERLVADTGDFSTCEPKSCSALAEIICEPEPGILSGHIGPASPRTRLCARVRKSPGVRNFNCRPRGSSSSTRGLPNHIRMVPKSHLARTLTPHFTVFRLRSTDPKRAGLRARRGPLASRLSCRLTASACDAFTTANDL